ncbi:MAG TPA: C40 family peptidase [Nocardioides sp.]|nr:C40 family peptidase [Nocardioides sp.]
MRMHRAIVAALVAVTALMVPAGGQAAPSPLRPSLQVGEKAWVAVSVTTLWRTPDSPHAVDAPALARPAGITRWLAEMTTEQRRSLGGRADTQALLGDQVLVVRLQDGWARVVVPSQPSQLDPRGYPGWVPQRQLTATPPVREPQTATVVRRTAMLRTDEAEPRPVFPISFGTRLPVVDATSRFVRVRTPLGGVRRIAADAVVVHDPGEPAVAPSRASLVRTARSFVGLPYLWSGLSGFGLDCSGLTWLDYRVHGIRIPRDALPQSAHGAAASPLRPGDLMFYATAGKVHHVSMYAGNGLMVHAPGTGQKVQVIETSTPAYQREYAGARRYLP